MARSETELLKGATETVVLSLLGERAMYGYELVQEIRERSSGALAVGQGTVYPLLYSLERKGLVAARWEPRREGGRRRKYYALTRAGASSAAKRIEDWKRFAVGVYRVLGIPHAARG